jgi:hypothetical protein
MKMSESGTIDTTSHPSAFVLDEDLLVPAAGEGCKGLLAEHDPTTESLNHQPFGFDILVSEQITD